MLLRQMRGQVESAGELDPQDVTQLRWLAICYYVFGGLGCLCGSLPMLHVIFGTSMMLDAVGSARDDGDAAVAGGIVAGLGLLLVVSAWAGGIATVLAGRFLAQRRRRTFCLVMAALTAITCMPLGTALGVFTFIVLARPRVQAAFERRAPAGLLALGLCLCVLSL
jgi:hypothetical protein